MVEQTRSKDAISEDHSPCIVMLYGVSTELCVLVYTAIAECIPEWLRCCKQRCVRSVWTPAQFSRDSIRANFNILRMGSGGRQLREASAARLKNMKTALTYSTHSTLWNPPLSAQYYSSGKTPFGGIYPHVFVPSGCRALNYVEFVNRLQYSLSGYPRMALNQGFNLFFPLLPTNYPLAHSSSPLVATHEPTRSQIFTWRKALFAIKASPDCRKSTQLN